MRKIGLGFFLLVFLVSCGNKKTKMDPFATITNLVDSATHKADTVPQAEVDNDPKPIEADESFDDFVYSYASDDATKSSFSPCSICRRLIASSIQTPLVRSK